ncbi:MAG: hypothetical protein WBC05_18190 [Sedimentisphaerales bacterium]
MMKKMLILISMVGLGFLLAWAASEDNSQQKAELESLKAELQQLKSDIEKTESERDTFKVRIALVEKNRDELQEQVDELTESRDKMQKQVEEFSFSRDQSRQQLTEIIGTRDKLKQQVDELTGSHDKLERQLTEFNTSRNQLRRQVDELTRSRNAAVADAQVAQERINILLDLVDAETKGFRELQDQDGLTVTSQAKQNTQPPMIKVSEDPNVLTDINWPPVVKSQVGERPTCQSFNTTRPQIMPGQSSTLSWQVSNAESIRIEPGIGSVSVLGSRAVKPSTTTTYTLIAANKAGESRKTCKVEIGEQPTVRSQVIERPAVLTEVIEPPVISNRLGERPTCSSFNTSRPRIMPGQTSTLSWQVSNADRVRIEPGIGPVSALGSRAVNPSTTTTYTLIASNKVGQSRLSCRVEINERITIFSTDAIHPRILLEEDKASGDRKVLPGRKPQVSDPNSTLGKFLGYRARKDETGKFIFIPVYENKQKE